MRRSVPVLVVAISALGFLAGCGGASKETFEQDIVAARDSVDANLAQIVEADSVEDRLARMEAAAIGIERAAEDVREAGAPGELRDDRAQLAESLAALADEIQATADTLEAFPEQAFNTRALNFGRWNDVQRDLAALREQGIDVPDLERHAPPVQTS